MQLNGRSEHTITDFGLSWRHGVMLLFAVLMFLGFLCWSGGRDGERVMGFIALLAGAIGFVLADIAVTLRAIRRHFELPTKEK